VKHFSRQNDVFVAAGLEPSGESAASIHRTARAVPLQDASQRGPMGLSMSAWGKRIRECE
jgi:hypothetical protein